jgi:hypothetical protein
MALLTMKQVITLSEKIGKRQELLTFNQTLTFKKIKDVIDDWNEKQSIELEVTPNQFIGLDVTPFWEKAPTGAIKAAFSMCWYDENYNLLLSDIFEEFSKPITPHPHAEMIMKYAEVAARRIDPWVEFEYEDCGQDDDYWSSCDVELRFLVDGRRYRHIGETK